MPERLRLPAALLAAVVVAEAAVLLMRPRDRVPEPVPVSARAYFSPDQLASAERYRDGQRLLYGLRVAVELGVLAALVARPPRRLLRATRRPVVVGAAAGAGIALALGAASLPVRAVARERAVDVGLVTQGWGGWAWDVARSEAIGAAFAAGGAALLVVALRRTGRRWWAAGAAAVVLFGVVTTYGAPVVLDPIFNRFTPLEQGDLRRDVITLAQKAGVDVGEVLVMDASRRTTAANAYVAGLGGTKRVVLYDTLLRDFEPPEVRSVVAHELAHVQHDDVPRGLLWLALVAPAGMFAVARLSERLAPARTRPGAAWVPAVALSLTLVALPVTMISNQLSREVEARADWTSLRLTGEPAALADLQQRLARQNVSDPDPPAWSHFLLGTHPTTVERLGLAEAFRDLPGAPSAARPPGGS